MDLSYKQNGKIFRGGHLIPIALIIGIVISTGSTAWGYWQTGYHELARLVVFLGAVWVIAHWRKWRWVPTPAIIIFLLFAAVGVWFELHPGWMFNGAAFALIAYDLGDFQRRAKNMPAREDVPGRTRRRIMRISVLVGLGLSFVSLLLLFTDRFSLDWGLSLVVIALFASLQIVAWQKR